MFWIYDSEHITTDIVNTTSIYRLVKKTSEFDKTSNDKSLTISLSENIDLNLYGHL